MQALPGQALLIRDQEEAIAAAIILQFFFRSLEFGADFNQVAAKASFRYLAPFANGIRDLGVRIH